jgi:hypothetical protein
LLSYLSTPYKSTIEPYKENVNLIAEVAQQKQNKYDQVLSAIFQKQNQLLDLDTLNEKVNLKKNNLLKQVDSQLNALASSDLTIPDNINKIEGLFAPITEDNDILSDVYYTKQIRENQKFAQETLKKDPSTGNQTNYNTSQQLVELYRKADLDQLGSSASYTTMFTPYIDIKTKKFDFLQKIGIVKTGYSNEFETITEDGVKYYKKEKGKISESEVLNLFNASLTQEDKQQLVLDGYHDYGNADLKELMTELQKSQTLQLNNITTNINSIDEVIKKLDANGDGEVDVKDQDANAKQQMLNSYLSQKSFYSQKGLMLKNRQESLDKFNANGDLVLGDRMRLFSDLKQDELAGDIVTLLSQSTPTEEVTKIDFTLAFNLKGELLKKQVDADIARKKEEAEKGTTSNYDYNADGIIDYRLGSNIINSNTPITVENLKEELGVEKVKTPSFTIITNNKGEKIPSTKDLSSYNIDNWKKVFDNFYKNKALNTNIIADEMMTNMSLDENGIINEELLKENKAAYTIHKTIYGKKTETEIQKAIETDPKAKKFEELRQLELNLNNAGNITEIHKNIRQYLADKWNTNVQSQNNNPVNIKDLEKLGNNFITNAKKEIIYDLNYGNNQLNFNKNSDFNPIYSINVTKDDTEKSLLAKIAKAYEENNIKSINASFYNYKLAKAILKDREAWKNNTSARLEEDGQAIYKELIDKQSFLTLTVSPSGETGKKEEFYTSLNTILKGAIQNNIADIIYTDINGKEQKIPKDLVIPESFTTLTFNTGTGTIKGALPNLGNIEYTMTQQQGITNGLPFGVPSEDLIGKQLILETHLNKLKGLPQKTSTRVTIGKTPLGDAKIYYDSNEGLFKVSYFSNTTKTHEPIGNISGKNTRETTMKFLQYLQGIGGNPSSIGNSSLNILEQ